MHVDYAGSLLGKMFLVLIDTHLKWIEVERVESKTTKTKVEKLRKLLSNHGIPEKTGIIQWVSIDQSRVYRYCIIK